MSPAADGDAPDPGTDHVAPRRPYRRPFGLLLGGAAAALLITKRSSFLGDADPGVSDPVDLEALSVRQLNVTIPADTDPDDASPAISEQLAVLRRTGRGGRLHLPPGDWRISEPIHLDTEGVRLTGAGVRATRIRMASGVSAHMVEVDADGASIERLTLAGVGADDPDSAGHGIRVGSSAKDLLIRDVVVEDVPSYGIGLQPANSAVGGRINGLFDGISLRNVVIRRCGQDGIDVKNIDESLDACRSDDLATVGQDCNGRRTFFRNLTVSEVGLRDGQAGEKPGIDLRGMRSLQNIEMIGLTGGAFGIRFRNDEAGPPNGLGGSGGTLENFVVLQTAGASPGLELSGTERVEVHNGFVVDGDDVDRFV